MITDHSTNPTFPARPPQATRRTWWLVAIVALALSGIVWNGSQAVPADPTRPIVIRGDALQGTGAKVVLRVATFNIHSGRGRDRRHDLDRTAAVLKTTPDLLGLNEVRGTWHESIRLDQAAELGNRLGMRSAFVPTERRWWHDHFGNAMLTQIPITQIHRLPLAGRRGKAFRTATLVQFEFQDRQVQLLSAHVDSQSDRESQLQAVLALFTGLQAPAILMGDLNSDREDPQLKALLARPDVVDAIQEESRDARGRLPIDWILARGFRCRSGQLVENEASDHPLAIAELELD